MGELNKTQREVENKAKETWRKADGDEDLADKAGNAGDDIRDTLGNAGDNIRDTLGNAGDNMHQDDRRR